MRDLTTFFEKTSKVEILPRRKTIERLLIFLIMKMSAKSDQIVSKSLWLCGEQTLSDVMSSFYRDKNKKVKSLKRMSDKNQIF